MKSNSYQHCPPAKLWKQFAAMLYDSLLITAILFVATAIALIFHHGEAIKTNPLFNLYLVLLIFLFYAWFWQKSGQTLGMKVWKTKIVTDSGYYPSMFTSFLRLFMSIVFPMTFFIINEFFVFFSDIYIKAGITLTIFLAGYLNQLFKNYTWHDRLSQTRVIDISSLPPESQ